MKNKGKVKSFWGIFYKETGELAGVSAIYGDVAIFFRKSDAVYALQNMGTIRRKDFEVKKLHILTTQTNSHEF